MLEHFEGVVKEFDRRFPWAQAVFIFDNSSNHRKMADDALNANRMNVNPGGKNVPIMHDTLWDGKVQTMTMVVGDKKVNKGLSLVLQERKLYDPAVKHLNKKELQAMLAECLDFKNEITLLQHAAVNKGHCALYLPRFHCELNPIEFWWSQAKRYVAERCEYTIGSLRRLLPEAIEKAVTLQIVSNFFTKIRESMAVYRKLQDVPGDKMEVEFTELSHKLKSHRKARAAPTAPPHPSPGLQLCLCSKCVHAGAETADADNKHGDIKQAVPVAEPVPLAPTATTEAAPHAAPLPKSTATSEGASPPAAPGKVKKGVRHSPLTSELIKRLEDAEKEKERNEKKKRKRGAADGNEEGGEDEMLDENEPNWTCSQCLTEWTPQLKREWFKCEFCPFTLCSGTRACPCDGKFRISLHEKVHKDRGNSPLDARTDETSSDV